VTKAPFDLIARALDPAEGRREPWGRFILRSSEGIELPLEVGRWMGTPDVHEERVLARAIPPVLDVGSVFDPLPGRGRWGTVLLLDGNVGIGGDPCRLLRRVRSLLRLGGRALLELDSIESTVRRLLVRVTGVPGAVSERFAWAVVGPGMVHPLACSTGFHPRELWREGRRWFARLDAV
jgi:hypothetical protein